MDTFSISTIRGKVDDAVLGESSTTSTLGMGGFEFSWNFQRMGGDKAGAGKSTALYFS